MAQGIFLAPACQLGGWRIHTYTPSHTRARELAQAVGGVAYRELGEMPSSPYCLVAVKPQQFAPLARELRGSMALETVVISVMAGVSIQQLQRALGTNQVVRVMPNTPLKVGRGMSLMVGAKEVASGALQGVEQLFKGSSTVLHCQTEDELDRVMAVSACGPGYLCELAMIFSRYLCCHGLAEGRAREIVGELFSGHARWLEQSEGSFGELQDQVASRGGATERALEYLQSNGFEEHFFCAMDHAYRRAKALGAAVESSGQ